MVPARPVYGGNSLENSRYGPDIVPVCFPRGILTTWNLSGSTFPTTVIEYLKAMQRHFGKVVAVVDRASPHRAKLVRKLLRENKNIKIIYLPKGSPYLNAVEECWHQGKRVLLVSEYYKTFTDMCSAISTYYRTARFTLDILKFANRKAALFCTNL